MPVRITNRIASVSAAATLLAAAGTTHAQPTLSLAGGTISYNGTFQDFLVPDLPGTMFSFTLLGADGGSATAGNNNRCFNAGGQGATASFRTTVGREPGQLAPGSLVRGIVGQAGGSHERLQANRTAAGGGGGGTGLVYRRAGTSTFEILGVAGGGGGAATRNSAGICTRPNQEGKNAETGSSGSSGNTDGSNPGGIGGQDGLPGAQVDETSGAGAGWRGPIFGGSPLTGMPGAWEGGAGGLGLGIGGFGFGGGGASGNTAATGGGGGGGFSGGGGGNSRSAGGGGGSYTHPALTSVGSVVVGSPGIANGRITYAIAGQSHDERDSALTIVATKPTIVGSTVGATSNALDRCDPTVTAPDVWYTYTNTTSYTQVLTINAVAGTTGLSLIDFFDVCLQADPSSIEQIIPAGGIVYVGVASDAEVFELAVSVAAQQPAAIDLGPIALEGSVTIDTAGSDFDTTLTLFDSAGGVISTNANASDGDLTSSITRTLTAGEYFFAVAGSPNIGTEGFVMPSVQSEYGTASGSANDTAFGPVVIPNAGNAFYKFTVTPRPTNFIDLGIVGDDNSFLSFFTTPFAKPVLTVYDSNSRIVKQSPNASNPSADSVIDEPLAAGTYIMAISAAGNTATDFFGLEVSPTAESTIGTFHIGDLVLSGTDVPADRALYYGFVIEAGPDQPCDPDLTTDGANPGDPSDGVPDGNVSVADLTYYVEQWISGVVAAADLTTDGANPGDPGNGVPDGSVSVADLTFYVEIWIDGCP